MTHATSRTPSSGLLDTEALTSAIMPKLTDVNRKVDDMRSKITNDPETLSDKVIKLAVPALAGLVLTKILEVAWKKSTKDDSVPSGPDTSTSLLNAMAFAAISGAIATLVSRFATKGSDAFVAHRQVKRIKQAGK